MPPRCRQPRNVNPPLNRMTLHSTDELQATGVEEAIDHPATDCVDGTAMTEVLAQVFEPASVRNQRRFGFNDDHVSWSSLGSDLKNECETSSLIPEVSTQESMIAPFTTTSVSILIPPRSDSCPEKPSTCREFNESQASGRMMNDYIHPSRRAVFVKCNSSFLSEFPDRVTYL